MAIDTRKVKGRRSLRFGTLGEIVADAEALAAGPHRCLGNYTLGQICAHLAQPMLYCLDGFPDVRLPRLMKAAGRLIRPLVVHRPTPPGLRLPAGLAEIFIAPPVNTDEGLARLRTVVARLSDEPQRHPSPVFGNLSRQQWDQFHCRHAELHLSFIVPAS